MLNSEKKGDKNRLESLKKHFRLFTRLLSQIIHWSNLARFGDVIDDFDR